MPTPFTHLALTQQLLQDQAIPESYRALLDDHRPAFQLGSVVADARVASGIGREITHFYQYDVPMVEHPWQVMLSTHPELQVPHDISHLAFLAGYVAHLATDESWALKMVRPHFWNKEWHGVDLSQKFLALHLILIYMDERDEQQLEAWQADYLATCTPDGWLPFIPDDVLCSWRDLIAGQIAPDGQSQTLNIFGKRVKLEPEMLRAILDDDRRMNDTLWHYVPQSLLASVETQIYAFTRDQLCFYLTRYLHQVKTTL